MSTAEYAASVQGACLRVTRLDASGNLLNNAGDSYTMTAFMSFSFTPEYEAGDEITQKSANGSVCVTFQSPDTLKRITLQMAICEPDVELTALISGGILLRKNLGTFADQNNKSIGWASPAVGDDPAGNGVAIEVWSYAVVDGKRASVLPYFYWIFPFTKLQLTGDRVIENGLLASSFEGYGLGNDAFGDGPDGRWEFATVTDRPYSYARTDWAPVGYTGNFIWHADLTAAISNKAIASNVATITTSLAHGFQVGDSVTITGVSTTTALNGTFIIVTVPTATTFTFHVTNADVASAVATGSATVAAGPRTVTDLTDPSTDPDAYNVPGNVDYLPTGANDNVVRSSEDPSA